MNICEASIQRESELCYLNLLTESYPLCANLMCFREIKHSWLLTQEVGIEETKVVRKQYLNDNDTAT